MSRLVFTFTLAFLTLVISCTALAQRPGTPQSTMPRGFRNIFDPARGLARLADANADGELSGEEWISFLQGLGADADGRVDGYRIKLLLVGLDLDRDGALTTGDVELAFENIDTKDTQSWDFLEDLTLLLGDADKNDELSADERASFLAAAKPGSGNAISDAVAIDWLKRAEAIPPEGDRNAMTPGVSLKTLEAALDANTDGKLTLDDLNALHRGLDANGDGKVDSQELRRRGGGFGGGNGGRMRGRITDEMRARPPLMPWQRDLDDALALVEATGKPLLICVNMDGETASESLAWDFYRDPEFVALAKGFICVVASPDRRNPRERDDRGRRIPDRRFGRLVNSEHIDIEPKLFERYFAGNRVAPRHVGVSPDGEILFDVFLVQDLSIVEEKLKEHGVFNPGHEVSVEDSLEEWLLDNPDAAKRDELERRFAEGDERTRARLASLALSAVRETQHPELIVMALHDESEKVRHQAVWAMIQHPEHAPVDEMPVAFAHITNGAENSELRDALVSALRRGRDASTGPRKDNMAFYLRVFSQIHQPSLVLDVERWRLAFKVTPPIPEDTPSGDDLDATAGLLEELQRALDVSPDLELHAQLAEAHVQFARINMALGRDPRFFFDDAIQACKAGLAIDPEDGRLLGHHAWCSYMLSDLETAGVQATEALPHLFRYASTPLATRVLELFAAVRARSIYDAMAAGVPWPPEAVSDARAAYELLLEHPAGTEAHWRAYLDLLGSLRAFGEQDQLVHRALARFPTSGDMHTYLRAVVLRDEGARALEAVYQSDALADARESYGAMMDWFWGLATLEAAQQDVKNRDERAAISAYGRSVERFSRSVDAAPGFESSAAHYQCLALAGTSRLLSNVGLHAEAVQAVCAAARRAPDSLESPDGLGNSPVDTARELRAALSDDELIAQLEASFEGHSLHP